jgi:hypothetical protein
VWLGVRWAALASAAGGRPGHGNPREAGGQTGTDVLADNVTPKTHGANNVYRRLRERGYQVFAVNPNTDEVEGDRCYQDLKSIPGGVEAVVIGTRPEIADDTMRDGRRH